MSVVINPLNYLLPATPSMIAAITTFLVLVALQITPGSCQACPIYLTISLDGKFLEDCFLEINWGPRCYYQPEWIGIFADNPSVSSADPLGKFDDINVTSGKLKTNVKVGKLKLPKGWGHDDINTLPAEYPRGKCLDYFVASFNGTELLTIECLKIQPNWMGKQKQIAAMPLKDLFIPGTHASGAFNAIQKSNLIKDYAFSQQLDVWTQLVFGIRFIDISVGVDLKKARMPLDNDNFWIVNENMLVTKLSPILRDVRRFVEISQEVVIINFSSFPIGFYKRPDRHSDLLRLIEREIGDLAYRRNTSINDPNFRCDELSVDDIRKAGKHLLLIYPIEELPYPDSESDILCPTWKTFALGEVATLVTMRLLFAKKKGSPIQDEGWICHAVIGLEQALNANTRARTTMERARVINKQVTSWLTGPWSLTANVVTVDFFTNTNLIDLAIYTNIEKAFVQTHKNLTRLEIISS